MLAYMHSWFSLLLAVAQPPPMAATVPMPGCPAELRAHLDHGPMTPGPLHLTSITCQDFGADLFGAAGPHHAPDGRAVALWQGGLDMPLLIAAVGGPGRVTIPNRVVFRNFAGLGGGPGGTPDAVAWSGDSRGVFTVRQRIGRPAGWAFSGLEPVFVGRDGAVRPLPPLTHPAGPLDAILWVGGEGRALAQFGTRGNFYRPEHDDPAPTLAMVDAARGRVLQAVPTPGLPLLHDRTSAGGMRPSGVAATLLPDGRIRAIIQFGPWADYRQRTSPQQAPIMRPAFWLLWDQGRPPEEWPQPDANPQAMPLAFSPGGETVLVIRSLQPNGIQISDCRRCPPPPSPEPATGPVAELVDVASRRVRWRVPSRATHFWSQTMRPAISPDGRYALIQLPSDAERQWVALIDMRNGRVLQRLSPALIGNGYPQAGFATDGRSAWLYGSKLFAYSLPRGR